MKKLLTLFLLLAGLSYSPAYAQTKQEVKQLEKQAKNGNIEATQTVFTIYYEGKGEIAKDEKKAKFYGDLFINQLEANAAKGDLNSLDALFKSYKTGNELFPKDEAKAKHYGLLLVKQVEKDANAGVMDALDMLPQLYSNGIYVEKDEAKAQYWEKKYQEAKAAVLRDLPNKARLYYSSNQIDELNTLIISAKSQEEADAIYCGIANGFPYGYHSQSDYENLKALENNLEMKNMVEKYCSDLIKLHYKIVVNSNLNIDNVKMPKNIKDYILCMYYNSAYQKPYQVRESDLKNLSDEGFAPATYKLVVYVRNFRDCNFDNQIEEVYNECNALMKKAEGQQDVDKEYVRKLISDANDMSSKGYDWFKPISEHLEFLLNAKDQAMKDFSSIENSMNQITAKNNKKEADLKRKEEQDARKLAAIKKQYGAKYVDAIKNGKILTGTPLSLLQRLKQEPVISKNFNMELYKLAYPLYGCNYRVKFGYTFNDTRAYYTTCVEYYIAVRNGVVVETVFKGSHEL